VPVWHASVAALDDRLIAIPVVKLSDCNRAMLIDLAKELLAGVGQIPSAVEQFGLAIHYRRSLTVDEFNGLPKTWRDLPAIDSAGVGIVLEQDT
jgi:hypothetical protein